jgi:DNA-binding response OmpR family regulator
MPDDLHIAPPATILFVEDEMLVRMDMADFLRQSNYRVSEAANSDEALEALKLKFAIDLVITDIKLPGEMNGLALAAWIRENRPGVQVIVQTADATIELPAALQELAPILRKPFTGRDLLDRVRLTLAKPQPPDAAGCSQS